MIEHVWTIICSSVVTDADTNNLSVFNLLEQILLPARALNPDRVILVSVELVTLWVRSDLSVPAKGKSKIEFVAPDKTIIHSAEADIDLFGYQRLRTRGSYQGLPYQGDGTYHFNVYYKLSDDEEWEKTASIPLVIMVTKTDDTEKVESVTAPKDKAQD